MESLSPACGEEELIEWVRESKRMEKYHVEEYKAQVIDKSNVEWIGFKNI